MWACVLIVGVTLGSACSDTTARPRTPAGPEPAPQASGSASAAATDACATAADKLMPVLARRGVDTTSLRTSILEACRQQPNDPTLACILAAKDDAAIEGCMIPAPRGEPVDQLDQAVESLRTYFFIHETFTDQRLGLTPAKPCCQYPTKKCPPENAPDELWMGVLKLDLSTERDFQYRFESSDKLAVIEAVGDRDCDGKTVTYRRELEQRADGNMHITVLDPPDGSD